MEDGLGEGRGKRPGGRAGVTDLAMGHYVTRLSEGCNYRQAAEGSGYHGRTFGKQRKRNPEFAAACEEAVAGLGRDGLGYVLADLSIAGERPEGWARRVAVGAGAWNAQKIVAEKNQGGDMVESVLRAADSGLPVKLVHAKGSKAARAEPVALRFETGRAKLAGAFPDLEDELCALTYAGFEGPSNSPDRADAMVWAMSDLFESRTEPRIRRL